MDIQVLGSSSRGNCYRVTDGSTPLLLECGISWSEIQKKLKFKTSDISACLITHEHMDHAKAAKDICRAGIDVYLSGGTDKALGFLGHRLMPVKSKKQFKEGTWTILPFDTVHDAAEPLGFLLASGNEKLLFATDTAYIKYRFNGLTHLMIECNYDLEILRNNVANGSVPAALKKRLLHSHFGLENVKGFIKANDMSKVQEIWLLHLSDGNSNAEKFKREIQELTGKPVYVAG